MTSPLETPKRETGLPVDVRCEEASIRMQRLKIVECTDDAHATAHVAAGLITGVGDHGYVAVQDTHQRKLVSVGQGGAQASG